WSAFRGRDSPGQGLRLELWRAAVRLALADREQESRDPAPQWDLPKTAERQRGDAAGRPCTPAARLACRGGWAQLQRAPYPDRHGRLAEAAGHPWHRTCHQFQRGLLPGAVAQACPGGGWWLHRRRIRLHLPWPGGQYLAAVSRRPLPARLR